MTSKRISSNSAIKDKDRKVLFAEQETLSRWAEYMEILYNDTDRPLKLLYESNY